MRDTKRDLYQTVGLLKLGPMSEYYFLWMKSEAAKNQILPLVLGLLMAQITGYYLLGFDRLFPHDWQPKGRLVYQILCFLFDLAAGVLVWGLIK